MLVDESTKIIQTENKPNKEWFRERIVKIFDYAGLDWAELAYKYNESDIFLSEKASKIQEGISYLIDDWSTQPVFDLTVYHTVILDIKELWVYYESNYIDENYDADISDLISGLKHL
jgi:hypothetical protein